MDRRGQRPGESPQGLGAVFKKVLKLIPSDRFINNCMIKIVTNNIELPSMVFEPISNPFVDKFLLKIKDVQSRFAMVEWLERIPYTRNDDMGSWENHKKESYKDFDIGINGIKKLGYDFPVNYEDIKIDLNLDTVHLLNRLHRYFTTGCRSTFEEMQTYDDKTFFKLKTEHQWTFNDLIHHVNDGVHRLENFIDTPRALEFPAETEYQIAFDSHQPFDSADTANDYFVDITQDDQQYFSDKLEYEMWLPWHQILGKCYWDAYFAYDDPTQWDCSEHVQYSGSFALGKRTQARNPKIEEWLKSWGIDPGPMTCGIPVARLVSGQQTFDFLQSQKEGPCSLICEIEIN